MARVTVEDCIVKIPNRFKLVMIAAQRSRELSKGLDLTVERDNDKNPVVALREIADETVETEDLEEKLVRSQQKHSDIDEQTDEGDSGELGDDAIAGPVPDLSDDPLARALAGAAFDDVVEGDDAAKADSGEDKPAPEEE